MKISGYTNIVFLGIRFIAISKLFPHHLNTFDNVPVNYNGTNFNSMRNIGY